MVDNERNNTTPRETRVTDRRSRGSMPFILGGVVVAVLVIAVVLFGFGGDGDVGTEGAAIDGAGDTVVDPAAEGVATDDGDVAEDAEVVPEADTEAEPVEN